MNMIKADFYRIFRSMAFWVIFGLMCICATGFVLISNGVETGALGTHVISVASGLMDTMMITIIGPVLAALFINSDFQNKTIQSSILYGKGRKAIVWAKLIPYTFTILFMLIPYSVATFIGCVSNAKFSGMFAKAVDSAYMSILAGKSSVNMDAGMIGKLVLVLIVIALIHASRCSLCVLLSFKMKSSVAVIGVGVILELMLSLIAVAASGSDVLRSCVSWTPFIGFQNNFTLTTHMADLLKTAGVSLVFICIIMNITAGLFRKAEVK